MINGVLVERTVKDVVPALKVNSEGLKKVLEDLVKQYNKQQSDMEKWKVCLLACSLLLTHGLYTSVCMGFCCLRRETYSRMCCRKRTTFRLCSNRSVSAAREEGREGGREWDD